MPSRAIVCDAVSFADNLPRQTMHGGGQLSSEFPVEKEQHVLPYVMDRALHSILMHQNSLPCDLLSENRNVHGSRHTPVENLGSCGMTTASDGTTG